MDTLRRTQSLKNLSEDGERSWITPAFYRRQRKSVSQLVQQYQSCDGLRSPEKENHEPQVYGQLAEQRWTRCRSMELLPQNESSIIRTMCALFESKAAVDLDSGGPPPRTHNRLTTGRDCPLVEERSHERFMLRGSRTEKRHTTNVFLESDDRVSRYSNADKSSPLRTKEHFSARQSRDGITSSSSVRSKSAVYLSRAAAFQPTGTAPQAEFSATQPKGSKNRTMADAVKNVSQSPTEEDDLPLPPPPLGTLDYAELSELSSLPVPPPKETYSTYYQQRQKSELKRLFKHIHPDLRESLDGAVDDDILKAVQSESTTSTDAAYQGEVQSMKWIFENWNLDNIGDPHDTKKMLDEGDLVGTDVRGTSTKFETSSCTHLSMEAFSRRQASVCGDVRTSTWLFETQPMDSLNKRETADDELVEAVLKEQVQPGDVSGTRQLFETKALSDLGRCNSIEDNSFLKLRSELQEQKGDIQKTVKLFHAEPGCAIKDKSGNFHKIKTICREEINSGNTSTARWLFETHPLDLINKENNGVKIIRGISLEDGHDGGVERKKWMFETQSFDTIQEIVGQTSFEGTEEADVTNKTKLFEMQPLSALKGDAEEKTLEKEEIIGGNVRTSLWLFETQPMDTLSDGCKVGCLQKITLASDEQGEVKGRKLIFESQAEEKRSSPEEKAIEKGDVKGFKQIFETIPLSRIAPPEEQALGSQNVSEQQATLLYAIEDSSGNFHGVKTVSREESIKGNVQNYKWMFETQPLEELTGGNENVEVLKGITREEDTSGDVKTAKWLFETQTIDGIHSKFNQAQQSSSEEEEPRKGDVKTCKWLFETKPMDLLNEKEAKVDVKEVIDKANVNSITWLFESQPLGSIKDGEECSLKLCGTIQDEVKSEFGVQTAKHLFETENLDKIRNDNTSEQGMRSVSKVDFQSGDVSRVRELFESQSLDEIGSEMPSATDQFNVCQAETGSVNKFTWLFENNPKATPKNIDMLRVSADECGDVQNKKFVFETSSLDKIHDQPREENSVYVEPMSEVDVKSSTMMFESRPLYAIRDKEGQFHEVTTVQKEEILSGDVRGARWQFETKPLDAIKAENEVYVIRAVTQEDVKKGDVKSARWKFETQPLDTLTSPKEPSVRVVEECASQNVQLNRELFESQQANKFVRMVSVTDVQQGDVRTSTWLFENHSIDRLKGDSVEECPLKTVHREDSQKGDVKRCTWLFESKPLDKITESKEIQTEVVEEGIPRADVKCTTWLFETTPLDKITVDSVTSTLSYLYQMDIVHSGGIIIEANESAKVSMAKFQLENQTGIQILKEELIGGNIRSIMLQLLLKQTNVKVMLLKELEKGKIEKTALQLPIYDSTITSKRESDPLVCKSFDIIEELFKHENNLTKGIIMQEPIEGPAEMIVYSLVSESDTKSDGSNIERGDVKSAIGNLLATSSNQSAVAPCRVDENEKGNVTLYKSCIEKGDLQYLKSLQMEECEEDSNSPTKESIEIIQGDIREAKKSLSLQKDQVERTVVDVLPGDVKNTKKVFSSKSPVSVDSHSLKEEIIPGDITAAKQQLSVTSSVLVEKEEVVPGDIRATLQSLERAKQQSMCVEREIVKPGTIYDMDMSAKCPETEGTEAQRELIISGDVKAAKKSLEMAKQQSMHMEREVIVPGKLYNLNASVQEESSSVVVQSSSSSRCQQVKTYQKVSNAGSKSNAFNDACCQAEVSKTAAVLGNCSPASLRSVNSDCNGLTSTEETEDILKGDVKAAIRSLQSAATEQRLFDKEDIVRGNVQLALESLEKSSVNVSKGDFNAAMIYMNSGRRKSAQKQSVVVSLPSSDTTLSPSISVSCEGHPPITTQNSSPDHVAKENSRSPHSDVAAPPLPQKSRPQDQKPALPPKPCWTKSVVVEDSGSTAAFPIKDVSVGAIKPDAEHSTSTPSDQFQGNGTNSRMSNKSKRGVSLQHQCDENLPKYPTCSESMEKRSFLDSDCKIMSNNNKMERNVIMKIDAAEEIKTCRNQKEENSDGRQETDSSQHKSFSQIQMIKVTGDSFGEETQNCPNSSTNPYKENDLPKLEMNTTSNTCQMHDNEPQKVVLREKKRKETDDERRQRLSVHKDEIMKGNVKAAMEIFENLRKREELKGILSQVKEIEGEPNNVDISSLKTFYSNAPTWVGTANGRDKYSKLEEKKVEVEAPDDDLESISSVESAFEDLEKASKEIMYLKEQTLTRLMDLEETIKKALYSVSNLKSESDIAGLSGLFDESLKSGEQSQPINNIRKISIGSCKAKSSQVKDLQESHSSVSKQDEAKTGHKPLVRQSSAQSSPSFISIHSAARKPAKEQTTPLLRNHQDDHQSDLNQQAAASGSSKETVPPQRKVSVLEVKTLPEQSTGINCKKTVSETYEETDGFGNVFVSSVTSTFVSKQSDNKSVALFDAAGGQSRFEVNTSPSLRKPVCPFGGSLLNKDTQKGNVFVTFSQPGEK